MENKTTIYDLRKSVRERVRDALTDLSSEEVEDYDLYEIVDGEVPVYNSVLLEVALDKLEFACGTPESRAFNGKPTAVSCIAGLIYEDLSDEAEQERQEILEALKLKEESK